MRRPALPATGRKRKIYVSHLTGVQAWPAGPHGEEGWRFQATCDTMHGVAQVHDRDAVVTFTVPEVARILGAIPAGKLDAADITALRRVRQILSGLDPNVIVGG